MEIRRLRILVERLGGFVLESGASLLTLLCCLVDFVAALWRIEPDFILCECGNVRHELDLSMELLINNRLLRRKSQAIQEGCRQRYCMKCRPVTMMLKAV